MARQKSTFLDGAAPLLLLLGIVALVAIVGITRFGGFSSLTSSSATQERSLLGQASTGPRPMPLREVVTCAFIGGNGTRGCTSSYGQCSTAGTSCAVKVAGVAGSVVQWSTTNCAGASGQSVINGRDETVTFTCGASCTNECTAGTSQCINETYIRSCGNYDSDPCTEWGSTNSCAPGNICQSGACVPSCTNECTAGTTTCVNQTDIFRCGNFDADACTEWGWSDSCGVGTVCQSGVCVNQPIPDVWVSIEKTTIDSKGYPGAPFTAGPFVLRGSEEIDYLNGIQVISTIYGADYNLRDIALVAADGRVIGSVPSLTWNGDHYYGWIMIDSYEETFPITVGGSSFTLQGSLTQYANGTVNIGIGGLNFAQPGAHVYGTPVLSDPLVVATG